MYPHTKPTCPSFKLKHTVDILGGVAKLNIHKEVTNHVRVRTKLTFKKGRQTLTIVDGWAFDKLKELDVDSDITDEQYLDNITKAITKWMFQSQEEIDERREDNSF